MKLMKVRFTEWRDPRAAIAAAVSEVDVASRRLAERIQRQAELIGQLAEVKRLIEIADTEALRERQRELSVSLQAAMEARTAAHGAQQSAGDAAALSMRSHPRVGTDGYQVLNEQGTEVQQVVDAQGQALPAGAVYGYEIVDQAPPLPAWAI